MFVINYNTTDGCTWSSSIPVGYVDDEIWAEMFCLIVNDKLLEIETRVRSKGDIFAGKAEIPDELENIPFFQNTDETGYLKGTLSMQELIDLEPLVEL